MFVRQTFVIEFIWAAEIQMLSIIMSGLNAAQKDLSVTSNNLANAGTTGFKRSDASFLDLYSNDPSSNPKTQIGGGTALGEITRSTAQGPLKTTGNALDLAITGRGFFELQHAEGVGIPATSIYTRAGNFTVNKQGYVTDAADNYLVCWPVDKAGTILDIPGMSFAKVPTEKSPGQARINLLDTTPVGAEVTLKVADSLVGAPHTVTSADRLLGYVTLKAEELTSTVAGQIGASIDDSMTDNIVPYDVKAEYQQVFVQGLSVDTKGLISANFSDGTNFALATISVATFPVESGMTPIGDTNFAESVDSGRPTRNVPGAPVTGDIRSGMLEESNVDMTAELMQMLKAQQVYNGNARMMQTSVDLVTRITDKL